MMLSDAPSFVLNLSIPMRVVLGLVAILGTLGAFGLPSEHVRAEKRLVDFVVFIESQLQVHAKELFGVGRPLIESALGPYTERNALLAIELAEGLTASLISDATDPLSG